MCWDYSAPIVYVRMRRVNTPRSCPGIPVTVLMVDALLNSRALVPSESLGPVHGQVHSTHAASRGHTDARSKLGAAHSSLRQANSVAHRPATCRVPFPRPVGLYDDSTLRASHLTRAAGDRRGLVAPRYARREHRVS